MPARSDHASSFSPPGVHAPRASRDAASGAINASQPLRARATAERNASNSAAAADSRRHNHARHQKKKTTRPDTMRSAPPKPPRSFNRRHA